MLKIFNLKFNPELFLDLDSSDNCFEDDMFIDGGNIQNYKHSFVTLGAEECHRQCQLNSECNHFVYDLQNSQCLLKRSDALKSFKKRSVVGPKYCGKILSETPYPTVFTNMF